MEKLILCAFNLRVFLQQVFCVVISFIYEDLGNVYRRHICQTCEKFGIKAIRKKRYLILSEKMRDFCKFPDFRRELILSELPSSFVVDMVHIAIEESCLLQSDIELIAVNRNFSETEAERLQKFKRKLLLYDFKNKKEIIKIFYKNSDFGEKDDAISQKLIEIFSDDLDFICWLASKGSSPVLKKAFVKKVATGETSREKFEKLKLFVRKQALADCSLEDIGYSEHLLDIRQYLTRAEDIEAWERYLLNSNTSKVINLNIRRYGIESKEGLKKMLELNDDNVIASYRFHSSQLKKANPKG